MGRVACAGRGAREKGRGGVTENRSPSVTRARVWCVCKMCEKKKRKKERKKSFSFRQDSDNSPRCSVIDPTMNPRSMKLMPCVACSLILLLSTQVLAADDSSADNETSTNSTADNAMTAPMMPLLGATAPSNQAQSTTCIVCMPPPIFFTLHFCVSPSLCLWYAVCFSVFFYSRVRSPYFLPLSFLTDLSFSMLFLHHIKSSRTNRVAVTRTAVSIWTRAWSS